MTNIFKVYLGLNDQEAKKQLIDTETAMIKVSEYLADHFEGATVYSGIGVYKHNDGTIVRENSLIIELVYVKDQDVNKMIDQFRMMFNQESIMKVKIACECDFIG